jgi:hypothetical protein
MMLGSGSVPKSTKGWKSLGSDPPSKTSYRSSLSIESLRGAPQWAQEDSTVTDRGFPRKRPCTKGVAIASIAQAAKSRSPVSKLTRCGVASTVTG